MRCDFAATAAGLVITALAVLSVLSVAFGWLLASRLLRPVRLITAAARDISASNLGQRLRLSRRDDEFTALGATEMLDKFDVLILADGGGIIGQAVAVRLGIARALVQFNAELRGTLKKAGFLTRDPRKRERKKYGQKGARKRFQFSKR